MTQIQNIEPNVSDAQALKKKQAAGQVGKFDSVYSGLGYATALAGPAAYHASVQYAPKSADIVGAAVNATAGYGAGSVMPVGAYGGLSPSFLTSGGSTVPLSTGVGSTGLGGQGLNTADPMVAIQQSQQNALDMLMLQTYQGQVSQDITMRSNLMASRDSMLRSIVQNLRT